MFYEKLQSYIIKISLIMLITINCFDCYPIEVTGSNIKYYKLTPNEGSGSYNFDYGTHDGAQRSERGFIKHDPDRTEPLLVVTGMFKYPNASEVFYIADEQGYRIVSKKEIDELHSKLPDNEIFPTSATPKNKDSSTQSSNFESLNEIQGSTTIRPVKLSTIVPKITRPTKIYSIPVTESKLIKVKVIKPSREITCPPEKCSGARESRIIKINTNYKFG